MSDQDDKQHEATGKRLTELRQQGNVLRSRDFSGGIIFVTGVGLLFFLAHELNTVFKNNFTLSFNSINLVLENQNYLIVVLKNTLYNTLKELLTVFIIIVAVTLLTPFLFGGWNFSLHAVQFQFSKLNPINNLMRLFAPKKALMEVSKAMLKSTLFLGVMTGFLYFNRHQLIQLTSGSVFVNAYLFTSLIKTFIAFLSFSLIFTIMIDMGYNLFRYKQDSKMSTQEVRDERRNSEGDPAVKRKLRSKQIALIAQRLSHLVPKADVVVVNPDHYAVALKYNRDTDSAPKVITKGKGVVALQIKQIAKNRQLVVYEAPRLARAIYYTSQSGKEIHPALYKAVAIILSYVFQLRNYHMGVAEAPQFVENIAVPEEFIFNE